MANPFDYELTERLRGILASDRLTESDLRGMRRQALRWIHALDNHVGTRERRLARLTADPEGSVSDIAQELRRIETNRARLDEMRALLAELELRTRELRTAWVEATRRS